MFQIPNKVKKLLVLQLCLSYFFFFLRVFCKFSDRTKDPKDSFIPQYTHSKISFSQYSYEVNQGLLESEFWGVSHSSMISSVDTSDINDELYLFLFETFEPSYYNRLYKKTLVITRNVEKKTSNKNFEVGNICLIPPKEKVVDFLDDINISICVGKKRKWRT